MQQHDTTRRDSSVGDHIQQLIRKLQEAAVLYADYLKALLRTAHLQDWREVLVR
jgi:hypothetical protein